GDRVAIFVGGGGGAGDRVGRDRVRGRQRHVGDHRLRVHHRRLRPDRLACFFGVAGDRFAGEHVTAGEPALKDRAGSGRSPVAPPRERDGGLLAVGVLRGGDAGDRGRGGQQRHGSDGEL